MKAKSQTKPKAQNPAIVGGVVIAAAVLVCYLPVWQAGFIWDDDAVLTANPLVHSARGLFDIWFSTLPTDYWPLTYSSFWIEWRLWGMNATGYHVTNVLLHATSSILLWRVLRRLFPECGAGAWLAALIFAVHPVNVESVAWITERKNTLCLFFGLLAVLWYLRFDSESRITNHESRSRKWYWLSLLAFVLSLLAKTATVTLPAVLLLYQWWHSRSLLNPNLNLTSTTGPEEMKNMAFRLAPFFLASLAMGLATVWFQTHRAIGTDIPVPVSFPARLAGAGWAVWFYLYKAVLPLNLSFVYPRWEINAASIFSWLPLAGLLAALAGLWKFRRSWGGAALFGLGSFVLLLLPVLGFFAIYFQRYSWVADHWQYFALPCVIALAVGGFNSSWPRKNIPAPVSGKSGKTMVRNAPHEQAGVWRGKLAAAAVLVIFAGLSWKQTRIYANQEVLWLDTLKKNPACFLAHNNLGCTYFEARRVDEALTHWHTALEIEPRNAKVYCNLGDAAAEAGQTAEAIRLWQTSLSIDPNYAVALNNLGNVLSKSGQTNEGWTLLQRALEINPRFAGAHNNLGVASFAMGRADEAIAHFRQAIELNSQYADPHYNLGGAAFQLGRVDEAIQHWQRALVLNPKRAETHNNLGYAFFSTGRAAQAIPYLERAIAINPNHTVARNTLARALVQVGRPADAASLWRLAIQLNPQSMPERNYLAWLLATSPLAEIRNGTEAVALAEKSNELTEEKNPQLLETLAAAYAEAGQFPKAVETARHAVQLAKDQTNAQLAEKIGRELREYEAGRPYREK